MCPTPIEKQVFILAPGLGAIDKSPLAAGGTKLRLQPPYSAP